MKSAFEEDGRWCFLFSFVPAFPLIPFLTPVASLFPFPFFSPFSFFVWVSSPSFRFLSCFPFPSSCSTLGYFPLSCLLKTFFFSVYPLGSPLLHHNSSPTFPSPPLPSPTHLTIPWPSPHAQNCSLIHPGWASINSLNFHNFLVNVVDPG